MEPKEKKGGFKGPSRRSRNLSRNRTKGPNQKKRRSPSPMPNPPSEAIEQNDDSLAIATARQSIDSNAARRKKSKGEIESSLRAVTKSAESMKAAADTAQKKLDASHRKNNCLTESTEAARSMARAANARAKVAEAGEIMLRKQVGELNAQLEAQHNLLEAQQHEYSAQLEAQQHEHRYKTAEAVEKAVQSEVFHALEKAEVRSPSIVSWFFG